GGAHRPGEHRESFRDHHPRTCFNGDRVRRQQFKVKGHAAAGRRSDPAQARHYAGQEAPEVGAARAAEHRSAQDDRSHARRTGTHEDLMATALITGASSGLGEEFALQLAREKYDLVLVARREEKLREVAERAKQAGAAKATIIAADLSRADAAAEIHRRLAAENIAVDYLVNNAGFGTHGGFVRAPLDREIEEINLNVSALVALTRLFLPAMVEKRRGIVVNVASTAAFQPVPWMATYAATKAFVLSFSEALAGELAGTGVTVMALCPGPTRTEFQQVASVEDSGVPSFAYMDAATVVGQAIDAARRGKAIKINGVVNLIMAESSRFAPRALVRR